MSIEDGAIKLGDRIRSRRLDKGLALKAVAHKAGISLQYLSEIERGLKLPTLETLVAVTKALDMTVVEVLKGIKPFE